MTLSELLESLSSFDETLPLVFTSAKGPIGAGYHVTELRHSLSTGIDCGGQIESWEDARLQLLDGQHGSYMRVGKFAALLRQSLSKLPQLGPVPLNVEFGHDNQSLQVMTPAKPQLRDGMVALDLTQSSAVCKPFQHQKNQTPAQACCPPAANATTDCCT